MSDKFYDVLNKVQRWLPLVGILYLTLCNIWHLPYGDEVNQTIVAVATFLAGTLEIANTVYLLNEKKKTDIVDNLLNQSTFLDFGDVEGDDLDE